MKNCWMFFNQTFCVILPSFKIHPYKWLGGVPKTKTHNLKKNTYTKLVVSPPDNLTVYQSVLYSTESNNLIQSSVQLRANLRCKRMPRFGGETSGPRRGAAREGTKTWTIASVHPC